MRYGLERLMSPPKQIRVSRRVRDEGRDDVCGRAGEPYRATKDLDLLALQSASRTRLREIFRELCGIQVVEDGLTFDPDSVEAEDTARTRLYQGVRVRLLARLGMARIPLQVDIGFGDALTPKLNSRRSSRRSWSFLRHGWR